MKTRVELAIWIDRDDSVITEGDIDRLAATAEAYLGRIIGGVPEIHDYLASDVLCITVAARGRQPGEPDLAAWERELLDRQYIRSEITDALKKTGMLE